MLCQGVVVTQGGWGGGPLVLWVEGSGALDQRGGALAAVLDEVQVMIQLPAWLLTAHLRMEQGSSLAVEGTGAAD